MAKVVSLLKRALRFFSLLPRKFAGSLRFRVFFLRETTFRTPARIHVSKKVVSLRFPDEPGVSADFLDCFIFNVYGLGQGLREVQRILDIGANLGFFSLAARDYYPGAAIHAYEPNPRMMAALLSNTDGLAIEIHSEALGGEAGYVTIIDEGASNAAQTLPGARSASSVRQISLQTAIERMGGSVDLLKLDCEGAEWEILKSEKCWKSIRNIRMEYHLFHGETVEQVAEALSRCGFEITHWGTQLESRGVVWASRAAAAG